MDTSGAEAEGDLGEAVVSDTPHIFSSYRCTSIGRGLPHPGDIAEAASLSAIELPPNKYPLWDSLPDTLVEQGKLSMLQLEGIRYACAKHLEWLPTGERAGFFVGDGAGVGKGRQISGIILDNYLRGRRQHVWMSTSTDLHLDAQRDVSDLGCYIRVINNLQTLDREERLLGLPKEFQEGILFMTYSTLVSSSRAGSRLQQLVRWLGGATFEGCLVLDECHKAKNFASGKEKESTKVALNVIDLQRQLPRARVVYCSATGVSEVRHMAYMTRMGLWGAGTAFPDFEAFLESMKRRGVSFLEMLAMEMKAEGKYVARALSYRAAEFTTLECKLAPEQVRMYDDAADAWVRVRGRLNWALRVTNRSSQDIWRSYWATLQRFFKLLCMSLKLPTVVEEAQRALAEGQAVVVGLQSTGEAAADNLNLVPGAVCGFISTTQEMLCRFIDVHFPTAGESREVDGVKVPGQQVPELVEAKQQLLEMAAALHLPPNFMDELIRRLGGPMQVAEMTGRRGRVVEDGRGRGVFRLRAAPDSGEMDSLNIKEREAFQSGAKLVAIISDAASTGVSLHAAIGCRNQRRRVHLTVELPWSADKAIQQLGRSHRSHQSSAPLYRLVSTPVGGERRFVAAVARRLQSLGALTRGDRRAASGVDLSDSNFDSPLGRAALRRVYDFIVMESTQLPKGVQLPAIFQGIHDELPFELGAQLRAAGARDPTGAGVPELISNLHAQLRSYVDTMGVGGSSRDATAVDDAALQAAPGTAYGAGGPATAAEKVIAASRGSGKDLGDVRRFLNRLLTLPILQQNLLFNYFAATLAADVAAAKADGLYTDGIGQLPTSNVSRAAAPSVVWKDSLSGLSTMRNDLVLDRGVTFAAACARLRHEQGPSVAADAASPAKPAVAQEGDARSRSGFYRSRRAIFGQLLYLLALQRSGQRQAFRIIRPNTGEAHMDMTLEDLEARYCMVDAQTAAVGWEHLYSSSEQLCLHGPGCTVGSRCQVGKRVVQVTVLSGSVVRVWGVLESVLQRHELQLAKADRVMHVVRVDLAGGASLVGLRYPAQLLPEVVAQLTSLQASASCAAATGRPAGEAGAAVGGAALFARSAEAVAPVDARLKAKAFRPPRTLLSFFKRGPAGADGTVQARGAQPQPQPPTPTLQQQNCRGCEEELHGVPPAAGGGQEPAHVHGAETQRWPLQEQQLHAAGSPDSRITVWPVQGRLASAHSNPSCAGKRARPGPLESSSCEEAADGHKLGDMEALPCRRPAKQHQVAGTATTPVEEVKPAGSAEVKPAAAASPVGKGALVSPPMTGAVATLVAMGFSAGQAEVALRLTRGDVPRAVELMLSTAR